MGFDFKEFLPCLDNVDLTTEQKFELIEIVYIFMQEQVDIALGSHPVQLSRQVAKISALPVPANDVDSNAITVKRKFLKSAAGT